VWILGWTASFSGSFAASEVMDGLREDYPDDALSLSEQSVGESEGIIGLVERAENARSVGDYAQGVVLLREALDRIKSKDGFADFQLMHSRLIERIPSILEYNDPEIVRTGVLEFAQAKADPNTVAKYHVALGSIYKKLFIFDRALQHTQVALQLLTSCGKSSDVATLHKRILDIQILIGDYDGAFVSADAALGIYRSLDDFNGVAACQLHLGSLHLKTGSSHRAEEFFRKVLALGDSGISRKYLASAQRYLSGIFRAEKAFDDALYFSGLALETFRGLKDSFGVASVYNEIGRIYEEKQDLEQAVLNFEKSVAESRRANDRLNLAHGLNNLGRVLSRINPERALESLRLALNESRAMGMGSLTLEILRSFADVCAEEGQFEDAYRHMSAYVDLLKQLRTDEIRESVAKSESIQRIQMEMDRKKTEIKALSELNELKSRQSIRERRYIYMLGGASFLLCILLFLLLNRVRKEKEVSRKLENTNTLRNKVYSMISHDIRSPIGSLVSVSETLTLHRYRFNPEEIMDHLSDISLSLKRLHILVENLMQWSSLEFAAKKQVSVNLNINDDASAVIDSVRSLAEEKQIRIFNEIPDTLIVETDRYLFGIVLRNLIVNALKFSFVNGVVRISARAVGHQVEMIVSDEGVGIPAEKRSCIFEFGKGEPQVGTMGEAGYGIGLPLCRELVIRSRGSIRILDGVEKGLSVCLTFPIGAAYESSDN
jgi:tetratricopeptide (TPR) repeat protein